MTGFFANIIEGIRVFYLKTIPSIAYSYHEDELSVFHDETNNVSTDLSSWSSFFGSYLGGIIGGLATLDYLMK